MTKSPQSEGGVACQWWVAGDNEARGPYGEAFVRACLKSGSITRDTLLCPVGGPEWKPVVEWSPFAGEVCGPNIPIRPVCPAPVQSAITDSPFSNPQLPQVANWICVYCIVVSPLYWGVDKLSCCVTGFAPTFPDDSAFLGIEMLVKAIGTLVSLTTTIVLFIGGRRLRCLRRSAVSLIKIGIWIGIVAGGLALLTMLGTVIAAAARDAQFRESTTAADIISFIMLVVGLIAFAFEVFALVWLYRHGNALPLNDN